MATTADLRKGVVIKHQNDLWVVSDTKFVNPGKGAAFTRTKMKSLTTSKSIEVTYKSGETVAIVEVQNQKVQFLYKSGDMYSFMDQETYETYELDKDVVGDDGKYLKEEMIVRASIYENRVVAIEIPAKVQYKVTDAPPAVKGDTVSGARLLKDVTLENGLMVRAPIFIKNGDVILINTESGDYCERINE